ncbi:MAG: penicillin-binding transpeptidase domain-containing protein, partial [Gemmatimonadota bacterium]|nr:penicillin-binding transpeptidase domain-containing protein [Gemmatimonadota bacterium]
DPQAGLSLGIGYGLLVTPLQMAMAYSVLANGGTLFEPALVEKINDENGKCLYRFKPRPVRQVLPRQVAGLMTRALVAVVDSGTGRAAAVPGYKVAGKTGTSMIVNRGGKYDGSGYIASFGGFFPAHDPQLVIFIIINSPAFHKRWGGSVAAPVFSEIIRNTLVSRSEVIDRSRLDLCKPSTYLAGVDQPGAKPVPGLAGKTAHPSVTHPPEPADRPGRTVIMPKVKGFTMRKAVEQLTELGLQVVLSGHIRVREQQPKPGTSLKPGSTCIITGLTAVRKNNTLALAKKDRNPLSRTNAKGDR